MILLNLFSPRPLFTVPAPAKLFLARRRHLDILLAFLIAAATTAARADDAAAKPAAAANVPDGIVIETTDERADPLRDAAREFLTKLADGDAPGARALFSGPKDQADFLDACLAGVNASRQFRKSFDARFPSSHKADDVGVDSEIRRTIRAIDFEEFCRKGDTASMSPAYIAPLGMPILEGLHFKLVDDHWKISHLTVFAKHTTIHVKFTQAATAALTGAAHKLDAGNFKRPEDALAAVKPEIDAAYEEEKVADIAAYNRTPPLPTPRR